MRKRDSGANILKNMMIACVLGVVVTLFYFSSVAYAETEIAVDETNFPDSVFRNWVITEYGNTLSCSEINATTSISLPEKSISDLKGIEFFAYLTSLDISTNNIQSLDLTNNTKLTYLNCGYNPLKTLNISSCTALTSIFLYDTYLQTLDTSKNTELTGIYCSGSWIHSLDLSKNLKLQFLYCENCSLTSLDVSKNSVLKVLLCSGNQLGNLCIANNPSIYWYDASNNCKFITTSDLGQGNTYDLSIIPGFDVSKMSDISGGSLSGTVLTFDAGTTSITYSYDTQYVKTAENAVSFQISVVDPSDIEVNETNFPDENFRAYINKLFGSELSWEKRTSLSSLTVHKMGISSLKGIEYFVNLKELDCSNNSLTNLDLSQNNMLYSVYANNNQLAGFAGNLPKLMYLYLNSNKFTSFDLSSYKEIETINLSNNQLESISSNCSTLKTLIVSGNQLKTIDVSTCLKLWMLNCTCNAINSLDIRNNKKLTYLYCEQSSSETDDTKRLKTLLLPDNPAIETIRLGNNALTELDLSKCSSLSECKCENNQLQNLILSTTCPLESLYCNGNKLKNLNVSSFSKLQTLNCSNNNITLLKTGSGINLNNLYCNDNQIKNLDISGYANVKRLYCGNNLLSSLNLKNNTQLESLDCQNNQISSLDFTSKPLLWSINCSGNQLACLDTSGCTYSYYAGCTANDNCTTIASDAKTYDLSQIPGFDVSKMSNLQGGTLGEDGKTVTITNSSSKISYYYSAGNHTNHNDILKTSIQFKSIPECIPPSIKSNCTITYDETKTLNDFNGEIFENYSTDNFGSGDGTWAWQDGTITPKVGNQVYELVFTPTDAVKYSKVTVQVEVTVSKALLSITNPIVSTKEGSIYNATSGVTYKPDMKLSDFVLSCRVSTESAVGSWSWKTPSSEIKSGQTTYEAVFSPNSKYSEKYGSVSKMITINVNKATPNVEAPTIKKVNIKEGLTLKDVQINATDDSADTDGTWSWKEPDAALTKVGTEFHTLVFTPADTDNYNDVEIMDVQVNVDLPIPECSAPAIKSNCTITYNPDKPLSNFNTEIFENSSAENFGGSGNGTWNWKNGNVIPTPGEKVYQLVFTPNDKNYGTVEIDVTLQVNKAELSLTTPIISLDNKNCSQTKVVYEPGLDIGMFDLTTGTNEDSENGSWKWVDSSTIVTAGTHEYQAIFTPNFSYSDYYNAKTVSLSIKVEKADIDMSGVRIPTSLAGTVGNTLSKIKLPQGYYWKNPEQKIVSSGEQKFVAYYNLDRKNYNDAEVKLVVKASQVSVKRSSDNKGIQISRKYLYRGLYYKIIKKKNVKGAKSNEVVLLKAQSKKIRSCKIAAKVKISGVIYKVTAMADGTFKNCKKLKKITIYSKTLKSIGKNALSKISSKAVIKVYKSNLKKYKKLFGKKTGFKKTMRIKKL